jgi:hypothetical protein
VELEIDGTFSFPILLRFTQPQSKYRKCKRTFSHSEVVRRAEVVLRQEGVLLPAQAGVVESRREVHRNLATSVIKLA